MRVCQCNQDDKSRRTNKLQSRIHIQPTFPGNTITDRWLALQTFQSKLGIRKFQDTFLKFLCGGLDFPKFQFYYFPRDGLPSRHDHPLFPTAVLITWCFAQHVIAHPFSPTFCFAEVPHELQNDEALPHYHITHSHFTDLTPLERGDKLNISSLWEKLCRFSPNILHGGPTRNERALGVCMILCCTVTCKARAHILCDHWS